MTEPRRDAAELQRQYAILQYFAWAHLPESLAQISAPFGSLAWEMAISLPTGPEVSAGLRKLLEAKDCFVRAALPEELPYDDASA